MATPEELLRKLDERFILGEIAEDQYQQMKERLRGQIDAGSAVKVTADTGELDADAPSHAGGMNVSDSVIKGNVTSGSASVGNININVGRGLSGSPSIEIEYEKCVMLALRSGGSLESIRQELDDRRMEIGLPIRLAREIEVACLESCGRRPIQGRAPTGPTPPTGPDPLTRFFKSASESIASMFSGATHAPVQRHPPTTRPTPVPPVPPTLRPVSTGAGLPPPVPRFAPPPPPVAEGVVKAAEAVAESLTQPISGVKQAEAEKEAIKDELRSGLKAELAQAAVESGISPQVPPKGEPAMRKPPPLPPLPPPLRFPGSDQKAK